MWNNKSWNSFATSIPQVLHMYYGCSAQRNNGISRCGYVHPSARVARMCTSGQKRQMCLHSASMCVKVWTLSNHHRLSAERLLLLRLCLSPSLSPNKEVRLLKLLHSEVHIEGAKALSPYVGILSPGQIIHGTGTARYRMYEERSINNKHDVTYKGDRDHLYPTPLYFQVIKKNMELNVCTEKKVRDNFDTTLDRTG